AVRDGSAVRPSLFGARLRDAGVLAADARRAAAAADLGGRARAAVTDAAAPVSDQAAVRAHARAAARNAAAALELGRHERRGLLDGARVELGRWREHALAAGATRGERDSPCDDENEGSKVTHLFSRRFPRTRSC